MPRDLPIGNGRLAVNFDRSYHLTDVYYPNIGKENQTAGQPCHFGAWRDGRFAWVGDEGFLPEAMAYQEDTLVTQVSLVSADLGLRLKCQDVVDFNETVYLRQIDTFSLDGSRGGVKLAPLRRQCQHRRDEGAVRPGQRRDGQRLMGLRVNLLGHDARWQGVAGAPGDQGLGGV